MIPHLENLWVGKTLGRMFITGKFYQDGSRMREIREKHLISKKSIRLSGLKIISHHVGLSWGNF